MGSERSRPQSPLLAPRAREKWGTPLPGAFTTEDAEYHRTLKPQPSFARPVRV